MIPLDQSVIVCNRLPSLTYSHHIHSLSIFACITMKIFLVIHERGYTKHSTYGDYHFVFACLSLNNIQETSVQKSVVLLYGRLFSCHR